MSFDTAQVTISVHSAHNLPKTDYLSDIDPYVILKIDGLDKVHRTKMIEDNPNPTWDEDFVVQLPVDPRTYLPNLKVRFELYDKDTFFDDRVGFAEMEVDRTVFAEGIPKQLPLTFYNKKYQDMKSHLTVSFACSTQGKLSAYMMEGYY